jgi:hypothetical protein
MLSKPFLSLCLAVVAFMFQGCAAFESPASDAGMSRRETNVLVKNYYWKRELPIPTYTDHALDTLLAASANPKLDGALSEEQASAVAVALAVVGDERFSSALSRQSDAVKRAVARDISYMWTHYRLEYPRTRSLLE